MQETVWEELGRELDRDRKTFRVCICMLPRYQSCEHITFQKYSATSEYNHDKKNSITSCQLQWTFVFWGQVLA